MSNIFKTTVLLGLLTGLLILIGGLIGGEIGIIIALVLSIIMNLGSWYYSDKLALAAYKAKEADKSQYSRLYDAVRRLSRKADIPPPRVCIIPSNTPNAFATGRSPKHASVALTEGILQLLAPEELDGVIAHELAHIKHHDILIASVAATIAGAVGSIATMAQWAAVFGGFGGDRGGNNNFVGIIIAAILAPITATIIQMSISRGREYSADAQGAKLVGGGEPLAQALEKLESFNKRRPMSFGSETSASLFIVNPFRGRSVMNLFATHPPTAERVKRLRAL